LWGDYTLGVVNIWGEGISSYFIVRGVNIGYQRYIQGVTGGTDQTSGECFLC